MSIRRIVRADEEALSRFFLSVNDDVTADHFRPHPFTQAEAARIASHAGDDIYAGAWVEGMLSGYGMLRGWDAGYAIPSLGIYIAPHARGSGLAERMMQTLHALSVIKGACKVRLRVLPDNQRARRLYEKCGYVFDGTLERGEYVGIKRLDPSEDVLTSAPTMPQPVLGA